jgi:hypothetical protein
MAKRKMSYKANVLQVRDLNSISTYCILFTEEVLELQGKQQSFSKHEDIRSSCMYKLLYS